MAAQTYLTLTTKNPFHTENLARSISNYVQGGDIIALSGDLGTGKTLFARAFIMALGHLGEVPSPTFTLLETYDLNGKTVNHLDLYRLETMDDIFELGIEEIFSYNISLIEWPERLGTNIPKDRLHITFDYTQDAAATTNRFVKIQGLGTWESRFLDLCNEIGHA
ncbi:MAG: tRNA (adenosine(37)-N6)-threonylcarbamoyltransferase complex ATPase subunit type 1 TsaE [Pseudomonadota bacterium]|nr:tRNA (adenosine(37)-N6)-threonylcarbamoyltransferase complex ATPase subunit type 1 TsaE [Pseudomonadota bacterium]